MHVYALLHRSAIALTLPQGVERDLEMVMCEQLAAVTEPDLFLDELQQEDTRLLQAVLTHDRVIRELFLQTTILPMRFTAFPTRTHLLADLQTNQQSYLDRLAYLQGKAEFTLKFVPVPTLESPVAANLKGKEYFLAKKQQYQEQQRQRELQSQEFNLIADAIAQRYPTSVQSASQQAYILAQQSNSLDLQKVIAELESQTNSWSLSLGEALPPFHFV